MDWDELFIEQTVLNKHFNHPSMSVHWDYASMKSTHLSTSGAPKRSVFSSSLNSGAWTTKISAPIVLMF